MYAHDDTIVAISSPTSDQRVIVRISGSNTLDVLQEIFKAPVTGKQSDLTADTVIIDSELKIDALLYLFISPHSFTGEDVAEIHLHTNPAVTEALMDKLLKMGLAPGALRSAGPGEFTAKVPRPKYSVLENSGLKAMNIDIMPHWEEGLQKYLNTIGALH